MTGQSSSRADDPVGAVPDDRLYTTEHEWVLRASDGTVRVGVTDFAQRSLGDVVYVSVPALGTTVVSGEPMAEVETHKSVADIYAPVDGTVVARNAALEDSPEILNADPYGEGWIVSIRTGDGAGIDAQGLLTAEAYAALVVATA